MSTFGAKTASGGKGKQGNGKGKQSLLSCIDVPLVIHVFLFPIMYVSPALHLGTRVHKVEMIIHGSDRTTTTTNKGNKGNKANKANQASNPGRIRASGSQMSKTKVGRRRCGMFFSWPMQLAS